MTEPITDDEHCQVHLRALELRRELIDLDTAACNLDLAFPDRYMLPDPPPDLHARVAQAERTLTQYLIVHRDRLGRMRFWAVDYRRIDEESRAGCPSTLFGGTEPVDTRNVSLPAYAEFSSCPGPDRKFR